MKMLSVSLLLLASSASFAQSANGIQCKAKIVGTEDLIVFNEGRHPAEQVANFSGYSISVFNVTIPDSNNNDVDYVSIYIEKDEQSPIRFYNTRPTQNVPTYFRIGADSDSRTPGFISVRCDLKS